MTNSQSTQLNPSNLPDLPGLEEVIPNMRIQAFVLTSYFLLIVAPSTAFIWGVHKYQQFIDPGTLAGLDIIVIALIIVVISLVLRILFSYSIYGTSQDGLIAYALLRRKMIMWSDISGIVLVEDAIFGPKLCVATKHCKLNIKLQYGGGGRYHSRVVIASIWQHLRRIGKVSVEEFPDEIINFWSPIPDSVPREIEHTTRKPLLQAYFTLIIGGVYIVLCTTIIVASHSLHETWPFLTLVIITPLLIYMEIRNVPKKLKITDIGITADKLLGRDDIPWNEVTSCGVSVKYLWIKASNPNREIWMPVENSEVALAAIRHIYENNLTQSVLHPWFLPQTVRKNWQELKEKKSGMGSVVSAYIASQPDDVAARLKKANERLPHIFVIPMVITPFLMFSDATGRISSLFHSSPNTLFNYSVSPPLNAFLLIFSIGALIEAILRPINNRTISSCREQWYQVLNLQKLPLSTYPKLAVILLTAISLTGAILSADNYYRLTSEAIYHNPVFSFHEQKYPLNQITIIKQSPIKDNHSKVIGKVYTVVLQNGKRFILSEQLMLENDKRKLDYTVQYISQKTKVPITYSE